VSNIVNINKPEIHPKAWGEEIWIVNNEEYCGKLLKYNAGWQSSLHNHKNKHETFYLLSGRVDIQVEQKKTRLKIGDVVTLDRGVKHRITAFTNAVIIEFSTPHSDEDVYREEESRISSHVFGFETSTGV
jgi:N-acetylneuraminate synthase